MKVTARIKGLDELKAAFQRLKGATDTVLVPAAMAGAKVIKEAADQNAPGPHNEISVKQVSAKQVEVEIGPDKEHWYYQFPETGADAHEITPLNKKALTWPGGPLVKKVRHLGRAAEPFLQPAIENNQNRILEAIASVLRRVLR